jgi:hypothetical protein
MALIDDIRRIAQQKESYSPELAAMRPVATGRRRIDPVPEIAEILARPVATRDDPGTSTFDPDFVRSRQDAVKALSSGYTLNADGTLQAPEPGWGMKAFDTIIDVVDTPGAFARALVKEIADVAPDPFGVGDTIFHERDKSFDFGDLWDNTKDNIRFNEVYRTSELPGPLDTVAGFAGDILTDPLTYVTLGTIGAAKGGAKAAAGTALDAALKHGGRRELAEAVVGAATRKGLAEDTIQRLAAETGSRGRGALTRQGARRVGLDDSKTVLEHLGDETSKKFGASIGVGRKARVPIAPQRVAEGAANLKGNLKAGLGRSKGGEVFRRMFVGDSKSAFGQMERKFVDELITGGADAATAARGLTLMKFAKDKSFLWLDDKTAGLTRELPELSKLTKEQAVDLAHAIEAGVDLDELATKITTWYSDIGTELQEMGVEFGWRENYVNHMLTDRARREAATGGDRRLLVHGLDHSVQFQNTRHLVAGERFLDETLETGSLKELNEISERVLGYKVFEDDIRVLMGSYLHQAQARHMRRVMEQGLEQTDRTEPNFFGISKELFQEVDEAAKAKARKKAETALEKAVKAEEAALAKSAKVRKRGLEKAAKDAKKAQEKAAKELADLERTLDAGRARVLEAERAINLTQGRLSALESARDKWQRVVKSGTRKAKSDATKKIRAIEKEMDALQPKLADQFDKLADAKSAAERDAARAGLENVQREVAAQSEKLRVAQAARQAMDDPDVPVPQVKVEAEKIVEVNEKIKKVRKQFLTETKEYGDAANAFVWLTVDVDTAKSALRNRMAQLDRVVAEGDEAGDVLRDRVRVVLEALERSGDDKIATALKKIEGQNVANDVSAWKKSMTRKEAQKALDALDDPNFQEYMRDQISKGFRKLNDDLQIPEFMDEALKFEAVLGDSAEFARMKQILKGYDRAMNSWRGWAVTSPGFLWRNLYSGFYGMYIDGVNPNNVRKFTQFLKRYDEDGHVKALEWARTSGKYTDQEVKNLEGALGAASASGWGLTPQEVSTQLVGSKRSVNPFSPEFAPTRWVRGWATHGEAILRGGHAFDVLQKGGDVNSAIHRIEKFHFNYRDISDFDRATKRVSPFWIFYSRNMALQADLWTRYPQKLNHSYFNLKRNLELESDPDQVEPSYFPELGAVRTPWGERDGGTLYFTPDLPSLRFRNDFAQLTGTAESGRPSIDPLRLLSDAGPAIKTPVEMLTGRRLFTDTEFKDRLYDFDSEGERVRRQAPKWLQGKVPFTDVDIPVVSDVSQRVLDLLPGTERVDGDLLMTDRVQAAMEDAFPLGGRATRLDPNQQQYQERWLQSVGSFFGVPLRKNTEGSIAGELYRRQLRAEESQRADQVMEMLKALP